MKYLSEHPSFEGSESEPDMLTAMATAQATIHQFITALAKNYDQAQVKIPFRSNSGVTEYIWAQVEKYTDNQFELFLMSPPLTHHGKLNLKYSCSINDIRDWVVILKNGQIRGGFTRRVELELSRDENGRLPIVLQELMDQFI